MNTPDKVKLWLLVACLLLCTFLIQQYLPHPRQRTATSPPSYEQSHPVTVREVQETARPATNTEPANILGKYFDISFVKKTGTQSVALVVASSHGFPDRPIRDSLASRFQVGPVQILPAFFKESFISDGLFDKTFDGSADVPEKLNLAKFLDAILLARENTQYSTNGANLENVITATMQVEIAFIPLSGAAQSQSWLLTSSGAGFKLSEAKKMAEDRLVKQIGSDTKMSLGY